MIEAITEEQAERGRQTVKRWIERAKSPRPVDHKRVEEGIRLAYETVGLAAPAIQWYPSPLKGIVAATFLIIGGKTTLTGKLVDEEVRKSDVALEEGLSSELHQVLVRELAEATSKAVADVDTAVATELHIRAVVIGDERPRVGQIIRKLVERAVTDSSAHLVLHDYADRVLGISESSRLRGLCAASGAGWWWPFEGVVVACERPREVHRDEDGKPHSASGASIRYFDGFEVFCRHGLRIPLEAVSEGAEVEWKDIQATADKRVQTALVEIKAEDWSAEGEKKVEGETDEERYEAAMAVKRLGGIEGVRDLIEDGKDASK